MSAKYTYENVNVSYVCAAISFWKMQFSCFFGTIMELWETNTENAKRKELLFFSFVLLDWQQLEVGWTEA